MVWASLDASIDQKNSENPWNVPDWRSADAYPRSEKTADWIWRWEFLRRREDYRLIWLDYQDNRTEWHAKGQDGLSKHDRETDRFGLSSLLSPSLRASTLTEPFMSDFDLCTVTPPICDPVRFFEEAKRKGQFVVAITPDLRITEQLNKIRRQIEQILADPWDGDLLEENPDAPSAQPSLEVLRRRHVEKYPLYLRLLDARATDQKPSWQEIARVLDDEDEFGGRNVRTIQRDYDAAIDLTRKAPFI